MTAGRAVDRAMAWDHSETQAMGDLARTDLMSRAASIAYTGQVVLMATDEDRAGTSMRALLQLAHDRRLRMTRTKVVKLLYLADLGAVASGGRARSGILWRWWHYGPYCQSLRRVEDALVGDGLIERDTGYLSASVEESVLSVSRSSSEVAVQAADFLAYLDAVLAEHGRKTAKALTQMAYETGPMIEAMRIGERGVVLDMPQTRSDVADVDAVMDALADRPDLVVMPQIDVGSLGSPDASEIVGVFRANRARANRRLLAD